MIGSLKSLGAEILFSRVLKAARKAARELYPNQKLVEGERFEQNLRLMLGRTSGSVKAALVGGLLAAQSSAVSNSVAASSNQTMALFALLARSVIPLLLDHPDIYREAGYDLGPKVPKPRRPIADLRDHSRFYEPGILPPEMQDGIEVLVVGSGPGGGAVAASLLRERPNLRLVLLEAGGYFSPEDLGRLSTFEAILKTYRQGGLTAALDLSQRSVSAVSILYGEALGGTALVNSTTAEIPPEEAIRQIMDPTRFSEFYRILEQDLAIQIASADIIGESNLDFLAAAQRMGYEGRPLFGNRGEDCQGIGRCPSGCPAGAKRTSADVYIPGILFNHPNTAVAANARAAKILWGTNGRAKGIEVVSPFGSYRLMLKDKGENGVLILAGGTIGSPDLLFRSGYHPQGLGEGMTIHPVTETFSLDPDQAHYAFRGLPQGVMVKMEHGIAEGAFPDPPTTAFIALGLRGKELEDYMSLYPHLRIMGGMIKDGEKSRGHLRYVGGETLMFYPMHPEDRTRLKLLAVEMLRVWAEDGRSKYLRLPVWPIFPSGIDPFYARLGFFGKDEIGKVQSFLLDRKVSLMTFAFHPLGTTREVVEDRATGRLTGSPNIFVADGSDIPVLGVNPQVAIGVSALSKGEGIAKRFN